MKSLNIRKSAILLSIVTIMFISIVSAAFGQDSLHVSHVSSLFEAWDEVWFVEVEDSLAYVGMSDYIRIMNINDPIVPFEISSIYMGEEAYARDLIVDDTLLYVGTELLGLFTYNIADPRYPELLNTNSVPEITSDLELRGDTLFVADRESLKLFNISDPSSPQIIQQLDTLDAENIVVVDTLIYVLDVEGDLHFVDMDDSTGVEVFSSYELNVDYTFDIKYQDSKLFASTDDRGLVVLDVSDITDPVVLSELDFEWHNPEEIVINEDIMFLTVHNDGLYSFDISDPANIVELDFQELNLPFGLCLNGDYAYIADTDAGLKMVDISDPNSLSLMSTLGDPDLKEITVADTIAYIADQSWGLHIVNVAHPENPQIIGRINQPYSSQKPSVVENILYTSNTDIGISAYDVSNPASPELLDNFHDHGGSFRFKVQEDYAYVITHGLSVLDISDPGNITEVFFDVAYSNTNAIEVMGDHAYLVDNGYFLRVLDISNPSAPVELDTIEYEGNVRDLDISENYLLAADRNHGVRVFDLSIPSSPEQISLIDVEICKDVSIENELVYTVSSNSQVTVFSLANPNTPSVAGYYETNESLRHIQASQGFAYTTYGDRFKIFDCTGVVEVPENTNIQNPENFEFVSIYPNPFNGQSVINFSLPQSAQVDLKLYNSLGQEVLSLGDKLYSSGNHSVLLNGNNLSSGTYFLHVHSSTNMDIIQKVVYIR